MNGERYLVRMGGAPGDDAAQFHFIVGHRADLDQFGLDNIGFSHEPSASHELCPCRGGADHRVVWSVQPAYAAKVADDPVIAI